VYATFGEYSVHLGESLTERQRDVIAEGKGSGSRATFSAVDGDEIGAPTSAAHLFGEFSPECLLADCRLDADRASGYVRQFFTEVDE
jgi:hypothetical protein